MDKSTNTKKHILFGTILGYLSIAISILTGVFLTPLIIQSIGDSNYAIYTLVTSLINLFLLDFGLTATTNTFLAKYKSEDNREKIEEFLSAIYKLYLIIDIVIFVIFAVLYILIDFIYVGLTVSERESLKIVFLISGTFSLVSFPTTPLVGTLSAYERFEVIKLAEIVNKILHCVFCVLCVAFDLGLVGMVISNVVSGLVSIIIRLLYCKINFRHKITLFKKFEKSLFVEVVKFSLWSAILSICSRLIFNFTPSILGTVSNSSEIAIFGIVSTMEGYIYLFGGIMNGFFMPKIARIMKEDEPNKKIQELANKIGRIQFLLSGLIIGGFIIAGLPFIKVWLKNDLYVKSYFGIIIVCIYQLFSVPQVVFNNAMYQVGAVKNLAIVAVIKAIINLILSFTFSFFFGAIGACVAIFLARGFEYTANNVLYAKKLKASYKQFAKNVYLSVGPIFLVSLCFSVPLIIVCSKNEVSNLLKFFIYGFSFAIPYLVFSIIYIRKTNLLKNIKM